MSIDKNFWKEKKVLITGHTGFKGSWLTLFLKYLGADIYGISREEKEGIYKKANLKGLLNENIYLDLADVQKKDLYSTIDRINPDIVFHLAAQSLVYVGYTNPLDTLNSNIIGTYNLLEASKKIKSIIISTTDKVYKNSEVDNNEDSELGGKDFYSASKVGTENVIEAFKKMESSCYISTVRSGNVIGGGDRAEKRLVTELINSLINNKDFILRKPDSIRPWQSVFDSIYGYLLIAEENNKKGIGEVYNLNSKLNNKFTSSYLSKSFIKEWGSQIRIINEENEKFKEVDKLKIDSSKAEKRLGWKPETSIEDLVSKTVEWEKNYINKNNFEFSLKQVEEYINKINDLRNQIT